MLKTDSKYERVRVGGVGMAGRSSYWLAPDHLLIVSVSYFNESYRRFYYQDIGAVVIQSTRARDWALGLAVLGLGLSPFALLLVASASGAGGLGTVEAVPGLIVAGLLVVMSVVTILHEVWKGSTCVCRVQTAVQTAELPGLRRTRQAERLLAALEPRIRAAQGDGVDSGAAVAASAGAEAVRAVENVAEGEVGSPHLRSSSYGGHAGGQAGVSPSQDGVGGTTEGLPSSGGSEPA